MNRPPIAVEGRSCADRFLSPEPVVRLANAFADPFRNVVATARTCYSSSGIVESRPLTERDVQIAKGIYKAGHHTTFQHAHFQFALGNVSRQFIWSFLHAHPFYNSEQVSQRYVAVKAGSVAVPPLGSEAARTLYAQAVDRQMEAYRDLAVRLYPIVKREYLKRFRVSDEKAAEGKRRGASQRKRREDDLRQVELSLYRSTKRMNSDVLKKAQEVARYVLPVATFACLYHTVSGITLLRYWRLCRQYDAPLEQRIVVGKMVTALLEACPDYRLVLEEPIPLEEMPEARFFATRTPDRGHRATRAFLSEFDDSLKGRTSRLIDHKAHNESLLAQAVREVLGVTVGELSDEAAIGLVLDPARNPLLGESLTLTTHSKLMRAMVHPSYTFRKKLSHTADSQDQRHRMTPASRPILSAHWTGEPDYVTPDLAREDPRAEKAYHQVMEQTWEAIEKLRRMGVPMEFALYLLPNATAIRFTESADLLHLHHKHAMRLCYLAQEEIWRSSMEEAIQIQEINPLIGRYLLPPCTLRDLAEMRPVCPEGERFCGVKVWRLPLEQYRRLI